MLLGEVNRNQQARFCNPKTPLCSPRFQIKSKEHPWTKQHHNYGEKSGIISGIPRTSLNNTTSSVYRAATEKEQHWKVLHSCRWEVMVDSQHLKALLYWWDWLNPRSESSPLYLVFSIAVKSNVSGCLMSRVLAFCSLSWQLFQLSRTVDQFVLLNASVTLKHWLYEMKCPSPVLCSYHFV